MSEHTPGPWKVDGRGDGTQQLPIRAKGKIIAAVRDEGSLADARLIAAAPNLLKELGGIGDALAADDTVTIEPGSIWAERIRVTIAETTTAG